MRENDKYDTNRHILLSSLASNVSARGGFYNASIGQGPDRVLIKKCYNQTEALDWSSFNEEYPYLQVNLTEFYQEWEALMLGVISDAISPPNPKYYGAGTGKIGIQTVYAFVLCSKDISPWNCSRCLRGNVDNYKLSCSGKTRGHSFTPSCYMRWDLYQFYGFIEYKAFPTLLREKVKSVHTADGGNISIINILGITVAFAIVITALLALGYALSRRRKAYQEFATETANDITTSGSLQFDFKAIEFATNNFQKSNKLGHGGFGEGTFPNGTEVAVKRLSKTSGQGEQEFKNEVLLVAKLQHRNLVRLLGFSVEGEEKILVYEYMPNKSLDYFLFDHKKRGQLDWRKQYKIIRGITRGILYLHQDSRLTIIHRDLKANNILLDADMNPKIADFGMARNFRVDQTEDNTGRVVGTFGYMPPEYVANGQFSMKSDVYSFGVLILEVIVGKKSSSFHEIDGSVGNLVTYVWRLWNNESFLELVDPAMGESYDKDEVIRCIHISLLCVQENPADRPTMSIVFQMLTNTFLTLPVPQSPGFVFRVRSVPNPLAERLEPGP
ncbi:unnamed protein product, partial [Arabidopsis halleri]